MDFKKPLTFEEFREAGYEAWKAQALKELKNNSLDSLNWKTSQNIPAEPYYDHASTTHLKAFHHHINKVNENSDPRQWKNLQLIKYSGNQATNNKIMESLEGGADGIILQLNEPDIAFDVLLKNVDLSICSVSFFTSTPSVISDYIQFTTKRDDNTDISGAVYWEEMSALHKFMEIHTPETLPINFRVMGLDHHFAIPEQLLAIAQAAEKLNPTDIKQLFQNQITMTVGLDEDYFQNIALIKAARIVSYQLAQSFDVELMPEDISVLAVSPPYQNDKYGPHENMLKSTTAAMAAIIGGCNSLLIIPANDEKPFLQRVARNVSHILKEEAFLGKQINPAAGSYFIDSLTEKTVKHIWQLFRNKV